MGVIFMYNLTQISREKEKCRLVLKQYTMAQRCTAKYIKCKLHKIMQIM